MCVSVYVYTSVLIVFCPRAVPWCILHAVCFTCPLQVSLFSCLFILFFSIIFVLFSSFINCLDDGTFDFQNGYIPKHYVDEVNHMTFDPIAPQYMYIYNYLYIYNIASDTFFLPFYFLPPVVFLTRKTKLTKLQTFLFLNDWTIILIENHFNCMLLLTGLAWLDSS